MDETSTSSYLDLLLSATSFSEFLARLETINEKALWHVYSEGIAMYVEQLLCENMNFYHHMVYTIDNWNL